MASIWQDDRSGKWVVGFVYSRKHFVRSCRTKSEETARSARVLVEETLQMLNTGRLIMPVDADPGVWILSGGKLSAKPKTNGRSLVKVGELCDAFHTGMFLPFVLLHQIAVFFIAGIPEIGIIDRATPANVRHTPINPF
jgi:hypothetical protein